VIVFHSLSIRVLASVVSLLRVFAAHRALSWVICVAGLLAGTFEWLCLL
jgi:hypothetical protein